MKRLPQTFNRAHTVGRLALSVSFVLLAVLISSKPIIASGPLMNDVGRGSLIWGTSGERTTYIGPYASYMAPNIRRIPEDSSSSSDPWKRNGNNKELSKALQEVGVVFGTDGKTYRYHFEKGVEPRRVIARRIVDGQVQEYERIVWEPVLIRVLEDGDTEPISESVAAANAKTVLPDPCAPASQNSEKSDSAPSQTAAPNSGQNVDPASQPPSLQPNGGVKPGEKLPPGVTLSVTVTTRDASGGAPYKEPVVVRQKRVDNSR